MPGHLKKSEGPDPDPTEFLFISREDKMKDMAKPYDAKKDCWVVNPDPAECFSLGEITKEEEGGMVEVTIDCMPKKFKADLVKPVNPPKFEKAVDVSDLTYLNDASVLYNLKARYVCKLMYTYSGLFCIAVNPYKRYPIYTERAAKIYMGKRRNEVPPHVFAISENAYANMRQNNQNQSMLITGESGAGKTENTKKVITYFGYVGACGGKLKPGEKPKASLEDQIVATNPVLEAFGNAKTTRNDNSSRFGKFIRIHFQPNGKLAGADIENYLLEKARVIDQAAAERGYHIFYNIMSDHVDYLKKMCFLSDDIYDYPWQSKGKVTVASIDDKEDMQYAHDSFTMLLFSDQERDDIYKITACCMHCGNMKFKMKGRDDQAEPDGTEAAGHIAVLSGVDPENMLTNYCKPKIKVGAELLVKGQTVDKATDSVGAMAKGMFDRLFTFLVNKCNVTLNTGMKRHSFIGVLDIAGFEIFDFNGFEQICINFCNEKLQQFFNHHMFVLEQEEYKKEEIQWTFIDFGMDLAACIELFEKPMGILSILEEESMFPKATDKSFSEKLNANCLGKSVAYIKPKGDAHFGCVHYAGTVNYNITGWLEKNKDPLNDTVVDQLKKGTNELMVILFANHPGQSAPAEEKGKGGKGGKKKAGGFKTVSSGYREQLNNLLTTLNATDPHFIRCIVPNETKSPGVVYGALIMHQLTCNGVLEGIRICQLGLPNRMPYADFKMRYAILGAQFFAQMDDQAAVKATFDDVGLDAEKYRVGATKVFFRAGVLGEVEEIRDNVIGAMVCKVQNWVRGYMGRRKYKLLQEQRIALTIVQRNIRKYVSMKSWIWFYLWMRVKPLINEPRLEDMIRDCKVRSDASVAACKEAEDKAEFLEKQYGEYLKDIEDLKAEVEATAGNSAKFIENFALIAAQKEEAEKAIKDTEKKWELEREAYNDQVNAKKLVEMDYDALKNDWDNMYGDYKKLQGEYANREHQIKVYQDELAHQEGIIYKYGQEKKHMAEVNAHNEGEIGGIEDRYNHLNDIKAKLADTYAEYGKAYADERKKYANLEKEKRKLEGDYKLLMEKHADYYRNHKDLEAAIFKKDAEWAVYWNKFEDEQMNAAKVAKQIKELQAKVEEREDEVKHEYDGKVKAEQAYKKLEKQYNDLTKKLDESGGATHAQLELYKKSEVEWKNLKRDLEHAVINHEAYWATFTKKHNEAYAELTDQYDKIYKEKGKIDKDKGMLYADAELYKSQMDALAHDKDAAEKAFKKVYDDYGDLYVKWEEQQRCVLDYDLVKKKYYDENADLLKQYEESHAAYNLMYKTTQTLGKNLEEVKKWAYDHNKDRHALLAKYKNLERDWDHLHELYNEDYDKKWELERDYKKVYDDAAMYWHKYETEGVARCEQLEQERVKINTRWEWATGQLEQLQFKYHALEKVKDRIYWDYQKLYKDHEADYVLYQNLEKKKYVHEHTLADWKVKIDDLTRDVSASQLEYREISGELFKIKNLYDESVSHLDVVKKENKALSDEIRDLMDQISEQGRNLWDMSRNVKKYEVEKEELSAALYEAEIALENHQKKVYDDHLEYEKVKKEVDAAVKHKEEAFEVGVRKVHLKAMDEMNAAYEAEHKDWEEYYRQWQKYKADIYELTLSYDNAHTLYGDLQKAVKKAQLEIKDLQDKYWDDHTLWSEMRDQLAVAERRANGYYADLEENKWLLEQSDRGRRQVEADLYELNEQYQDIQNHHNALFLDHKKLETDYATMSTDHWDMFNDNKDHEDRAKDALVEAARLAEELHADQEKYYNLTVEKKSLEVKYKDLQQKYEWSEKEALRSGKWAYAKLEHRHHELTQEFDHITYKHSDIQNKLKKHEAKIKELHWSMEENKKTFKLKQDLYDKLYLKVKTYYAQHEEADAIAYDNLHKWHELIWDKF